jgi:2-polyprenyl-6-methoxyphenol hydroxylase-like FAD-dependent oxidoreductase
MEDAAILARCLDETGPEDIEAAFKLYESHRKPRTSVIQAISSANTWMRDAACGDPDWLYGYDAWNVPLSEAVATE